MRRLAPALLLSAVIAGCGTVPFRETELVPLSGSEPAAVVDRFREHLPERFRTMSALVFEFAWEKFSALGVTEVNRADGSFTALAMNPMGMKLFEITGGTDGITTNFMLPAMDRRGDAASTIGEDIRRIYLGQVPSPAATVQRERYRILFREQAGQGTMEYVFAGAGAVLIEKKYREGNETVWQVRYYDYRREGDKDHPMGIVLDNFRHGYRLIVKVKEILV